MSTAEATSTLREARTMHLFLTRPQFGNQWPLLLAGSDLER